MKKTNKEIIIFDVDDTLIKGNLTFFFVKCLSRESLYLLISCIPIIIRGAILKLSKFPKIISQFFFRERNIYKLDRSICKSIKKFYCNLYKTLCGLGLTGKNLERKASSILTKRFFEENTYSAGLEKLKEHIKNQRDIVVLLSGSPQELLNVFFKNICNDLKNNNISYEGRFFAQGTILRKKANPCIGSEKNKFLKRLLYEKGYKNYVVKFIYSDNSYLSDLPIIIESQNGGAVINKKTRLYSSLPKDLIDSIKFLPEWKE